MKIEPYFTFENLDEKVWKVDFVDITENPLAFLSETLSRQDLLGYTNQDQLDVLGDPPFLRLQLM